MATSLRPRPEPDAPAAHPGWAAAFAAYAGALAVAGRSPRTLRAYGAAVTRLAVFLGPDCGPAEADGPRVMAYFGSRLEAGMAPATMALDRTAIRRFLKYLSEERAADPEVVRLIDRVRDRRRRVRHPVFLSDEEAMAFLRAVAQSQTPPRDGWLVLRDKLLFRLFLTTGMRLSEALSLSVGGVQQAVRDATFRIVGKGDKERFIPVEPGLVPLVEAYLRVRPRPEGGTARRGAPLFVARHGGPLGPRTVQYLTAVFAREAGIMGKAVTPHKLRHTFATSVLRESQNLRLVQELLGHESLVTTQIYTHVLSGDARRAVDALPYARRTR